MSRSKAVGQREEFLVCRLGFGQKREQGDERKADFAWNLLTLWPGSNGNLATIEVILSHALNSQSPYHQSANEWIGTNIATSRVNIFFALLHFATLSPDRVGPVAEMAERFRPLRSLEQQLLLEALQGNPLSWEQLRGKSPIPDVPPSHRMDVSAACKMLMSRPSDREAVALALQSVQKPQLRQMPRLQVAIVRVFVKTGDDTLLQEISDQFTLLAQACVDLICRGYPYHTAEGCHLHRLAQMVGNNITTLPHELAQSLVRRLVGNRTFDGFFILNMFLGSDDEMPLDHLTEMIGKLCQERQTVDEAMDKVCEVEAAKEKDNQLRIYEQEAQACINDVADKLAISELVGLIGKLHQMYARYPKSQLLDALGDDLLAKNELTTDSLLPLATAATLPASILCAVLRKFGYPWECSLFQQWLRKPTAAANEKDKRSLNSLLCSYIKTLAKIRSSEESSQLTVGRLVQTHAAFLLENHHLPSVLDFQLAEGEELCSILPRDGHDYLHSPQIWQDPTWQAVLLEVAARDESGAILRWLLDSAEPVLSHREDRSNNEVDIAANIRWLEVVLPSWQDQASTMRLVWMQMVTAPYGDRHRLILPYLASSWQQMTDEEKALISAYAKKNWQFITEHAIPKNFVEFMTTVLTNEEQLDEFFARPLHNGTNNKIGRFSELSHLFKTPESQKRLLNWMMKHAEDFEPHTLTHWMLRLNFQRFANARIILRRLLVERLFSKKTIDELTGALEPYGAS